MKRTQISILAASIFALLVAGCGTTRWTDTSRTATEQFLISQAIDEAVGRLDFRPLAGKAVFFDEKYLEDTVHKKYLASSLRQQLVASGVLLHEKAEEADYIVEARSGVIGTNRNDSMFGVPSLSIPPVVPGIPTNTPEVALAKKTNQQAAAKIAVYARHQATGNRIWQSGVVTAETFEKNSWLFGIGPVQQSSYRDGPRFIGETVKVPFVASAEAQEEAGPILLHQEAFWDESSPEEALINPIQQADHTVPSDAPSSSPAQSQANQPTSVAEPFSAKP